MAEGQKTGLFSKAPPPPPPRQDLGNVSVRIRLIEEKINNLNRKVETMESNVLENYQKTANEIKVLDSEFIQLKRVMETMQQKMDLVVKELKMTAGKEDVEVLKKYLDLWNPVKFATREELQGMEARLSGQEEELTVEPAEEKEEDLD